VARNRYQGVLNSLIAEQVIECRLGFLVTVNHIAPFSLLGKEDFVSSVRPVS